MAHGVIDSRGFLVITLDTTAEQLAAPSEMGSPRIYLPCAECSVLQIVPPTITKVVCRWCNVRAGRLVDGCARLCPCERCSRSRPGTEVRA